MSFKQIDTEGLKQIQLDILTSLDEFCKTNNIDYSMGCGTLLGAIRHKGFIPWDDDIDIYLLRKDYNRLLSLFPQTWQDKYKIVSLERDPEWEYPYAKAYDATSRMDEFVNCNCEIGVGIDIYPIDDVPPAKKWMKYNKRRLFLQNLFMARCIRFTRERSLLKTAILCVAKAATCFMTRRKFGEFLSRYAQKHNDKGYTDCFETAQGIGVQKPFSKTLFNKIEYIPFEDRRFKAFADADTYLKNAYGDYMKLPPVEKRVTHHKFKAFVEIPDEKTASD